MNYLWYPDNDNKITLIMSSTDCGPSRGQAGHAAPEDLVGRALRQALRPGSPGPSGELEGLAGNSFN